MTKYIHDEWCDVNLAAPSECNCYVRLIEERDAFRVLTARIEALDAMARAERSHSMSVEDDLLTAQTRIEALERVLRLAQNRIGHGPSCTDHTECGAITAVLAAEGKTSYATGISDEDGHSLGDDAALATTHERLWHEWYALWHDANASKPKPSYEEWLEARIEALANEKAAELVQWAEWAAEHLRAALAAEEEING